MKVMVLITAHASTEAGAMPSRELMEAMTAFNEDLVAAGKMVMGEGLQPTAKGARIDLDGDERHVTRGPFALDGSIICGFWIWTVDDLDDAIAWVKKCPPPYDGRARIEIRPLYALEDFGDAATPEIKAREDRMRAQIDEQHRQ